MQRPLKPLLHLFSIISTNGVNVIKGAESGKRPTDAVIKKFESALSIELMVEREAEETRFVNSGNSRGMTFGDYFNNMG